MGQLTPRERVRLALSHEETDRVPVDFLATPETWGRLKRHLGISDEGAILRRLGIDLRHPRQAYCGPPRGLRKDGTWTDEWGVIRAQVPHEGGSYEEIVHHPLAQAAGLDDLQAHGWPSAEWWDPDSLRLEVERLDGEGSYALALEEFGDPGGIFEIAWYLRGMENLLLDMVERPELAYALMQRVTDCFIGRLDRVMATLGSRIDLIWTSDDIAHQYGPFMSTRMWTELVAPHHERLNRRVHDWGTKVMYHSCGAVRSFIPGLIEIGVDVLDVLQFSASGMDPGEIKETFGDRLCFHGGVDVQQLLPHAGVEGVMARTGELIDILGRGGGFILSPTHNIQVDTPPENILAVYRRAGSLEAG